MLLKSISINFQLARGWFALTMLLALPAAFASSDSLFRYATYFIMLIGVQKITGESYFGDESDFLQTLPISQKYMIAGKALSGGVILGLTITLINVLSSASFILEAKDTSLQLPNYFEKMSTLFMFQGMTPWQVGVIMALIPVILILLSCIFCVLMIWIQRLIYASKQKKYARALSMVVMVFLLGLPSTIFAYARNQHGPMTGDTEFAFILYLGMVLILAGVLVGLVQLSTVVFPKQKANKKEAAH